MGTQINPIDWQFILETIKEEKCILFLGPEVYTDAEGLRMEDALNLYLDLPHNPDIQSYYQEDNLFLFTSRAKKTKTFYKIKHFYQQDFPQAEDMFQKIVEIPFHLIIKMTPDRTLSKEFQKAGINCQFQFYWRNRPPGTHLKTPSVSHPLVYNMLGSIDQQESMILTHNDLFNYFESVFSGNSMPEKFKRMIKEANNFLFLGIPFEKWYMQLLLRILYIHTDYDFARYASNQKLNEEIRTFCFEQFKIEFVPKQIHEFVQELHHRCKEIDLLRRVGEAPPSAINKLKGWVAKDRIDEVLEGLRSFLETVGDAGEDLLDDVILLSNRFNRLKKRINQGIIDDREADLHSNRVRKEILDMLNEAEALE